MHKVLVNRLGGLSLTRKSVVKLTDRPDMASEVYRGRKTIKQQQQKKEQELFAEDVVVEEAYVCVAWWKGAADTFGNSALFDDRYIVMTDVGEGAGDSVEYRYQLIRRAVTLRQISK